MLSRLKFKLTDLANEMLDQLPKSVFESATTTFCDPAIGGGQMIAAVESRLRAYGHSDENIASRVFGFEENPMRLRFARHKYNLLAQLNIYKLDESEINMKFDVVFANPPYEGGRCLHQQFFNKAVEDLVVDGGTVCFIQPATVYINKKPNQKNAVIDMRNHILNNTTKVIMKESGVFENANVATDLSITILTKDGSESGVIDWLTYLNGNTYTDAKFNEVNASMMDHEIYKSLWQKIFAQIDRSGALQDKIITSGQMFRITKVRGNMNCDDFYTFMSRDKKYWVGESNHGLEVNSEDQIENIASYFKTYLARFALSLYKFNTAMVNGELKSVPLVDFNQEWTDEKLMAEWGITEEEYAEILKVIPAYYD